MLLPCGRNDAMFAIIVPEGDASLAKPTSSGRADIICPTEQTSWKKTIAFAIAFFLVEHRGLEPLTPTLPVSCAPNCANAPFGIFDRFSRSRIEYSTFPFGCQSLFCIFGNFGFCKSKRGANRAPSISSFSAAAAGSRRQRRSRPARTESAPATTEALSAEAERTKAGAGHPTRAAAERRWYWSR